jgi:hypothetical protein
MQANHFNVGDNQGAGNKEKTNNYIDLSTVLGLIFNENAGPNFEITSSHAQATVWTMIDAFKNGAYAPKQKLSTWSLNNVQCSPEGLPLNPGIGRYPEDIYDGHGWFFPGNSDKYESAGAGFWFLATNAFAEFFYKSAIKYQTKGMIEINADNMNFWKFVGIVKKRSARSSMVIMRGSSDFEDALNKLFLHGDAFMRRTMQSVPKTGFMAEQFHGDTGSQMSTADLCWSYASVVTANTARQNALKSLKRMPEPHKCTPGRKMVSCPVPGQLNPKDRVKCQGSTAQECTMNGCCWSFIYKSKQDISCFRPIE